MTNKSSENHKKIHRPQKNYYIVYDSKICKKSGIFNQSINPQSEREIQGYQSSNQ